jgi:hypothetical protein
MPVNLNQLSAEDKAPADRIVAFTTAIQEALRDYLKNRLHQYQVIPQNRLENIIYIMNLLPFSKTQIEQSNAATVDSLAIAIHDYMLDEKKFTTCFNGFFSHSVMRNNIDAAIENFSPALYAKEANIRKSYRDNVLAMKTMSKTLAEAIANSEKMLKALTTLNTTVSASLPVDNTAAVSTQSNPLLVIQKDLDGYKTQLAKAKLQIKYLKSSLTVQRDMVQSLRDKITGYQKTAPTVRASVPTHFKPAQRQQQSDVELYEQGHNNQMGRQQHR